MPVMSVGGLASGLDTNNIIAQLTALEQAKVTREIQKRESAQSTLDKFKELETKLLSLQTKAKGLELPKDFNLFKSSSSYEDYATISGGEGATAGNYELVVHQLATTLKVASNSYSAVNKSMVECGIMQNGEGPITVTLSTSAAAQKTDAKKTVDIVINSSDTLKDIVNKINAAEGAGVKASIMSTSNGENRIVLTAVDSGTNGFYITDNSATLGIPGPSFLSKLGIIDDPDTKQKATSGNALTVLGGGPATVNTTFDKLNTVLNKNNLVDGDKIGIYLPVNCGRVDSNGDPIGGWVTFDLYGHEAGAGKARKIDDVLNEINSALQSTGANFKASLNNSGEIVLEGDLEADANFCSEKDLSTGDPTLTASERTYKTFLEQVKIQIGTFGAPGTLDEDLTEDDIIVKRDMGTLANRNIFKEDNIITNGRNAFYTLDGMSISSQSNDDDKTILGTTFTLKKADPDKVVKLSLESDMSGLADKISEFVDEFNALLKFIDENAKAQVVEETDKDGKKTNKRVVGAFTGDSGISGLRENLRSMFSGIINEITNTVDNGYSTVYSSAARVGILASKEGYYEVDKEKLVKALNADFEGVRKLFTSGGFSDTPGFSVGRFTKDSEAGVYTYKNGEWYLNDSKDPVKGTWVGNSIFTTSKGLSIELPGSPKDGSKVTFTRGIAGQISTFVEQAKTGYYNQRNEWVDGYIKQSNDKYQKRIEEIQKRVDQLQRRVDNYNERLVKQFSALEKSMSNLQAQSANMLSALGSIDYSGGKK
jgi:flagellar capping protein FliD